MTDGIPEPLLERLRNEAERRGIPVAELLTGWLNGVRDTRDMHALTDANPDLIARFNRELQYTYVNPASAQILAKPAEDIIGYTLYDMDIPRELADQLTRELQIPFRTGREHWCEYSLQGRKHTHFFEVQIIPVVNVEGVVESVLTVSRNVTRRKEIEAALRESEQRYRSIVEGQIDVICLYYPDTTVAYVNDSYCQYFGVRREDIIGKSFMRLTDPNEAPRILARLAEVLRDPSPKIEEYYMTSPQGVPRWVSWVDHGITDEDGKVVMVQAIGRDITHMKIIEQQLALERERYELLFNENPLPLWVYDLETLTYIAVNDAAVRLYGYTRDEFLKMTVMDIRPREDVPRLYEFIRKEKPVEHSSLGLWRHQRKNGEVFDVEVTGRDITFNNRPARLVMAVDVTERRALEAERLYAKSLEIELQKEREVTMLKERFTSMVTHEFRTPLSVIISTVDILKHYLTQLTKENLARKLDIITSEAQRMSTLLDDVLTLSRATAGKLRVTPEVINLVEVVHGLVENLRLTDRDQHVFEVVADSDEASVVSDRRLLEQILINLLTNAVKYSPTGTTIKAEVRPADDRVTLKVIDEGRGIPAPDQPRVFEAFHRADNATGVEGTGLGLAIVKESVTLLGGDVRFQSSIGKGTTFIVDLPPAIPM